MNPIAKQAWIEGLEGRSALGPYIQAHGPLKERTPKGDAYCAIGVLVHQYCYLHNKPWAEVVDGLVVDADVMTWAGIVPTTIIISAGERTGYIHTLNDYFKIPFPVLAEAIRTQL